MEQKLETKIYSSLLYIKEDGSQEFVHDTIKEYYLAKYFAEKINNDQISVEEFWDKYESSISKIKKDNNYVRKCTPLGFRKNIFKLLNKDNSLKLIIEISKELNKICQDYYEFPYEKVLNLTRYLGYSEDEVSIKVLIDYMIKLTSTPKCNSYFDMSHMILYGEISSIVSDIANKNKNKIDTFFIPIKECLDKPINQDPKLQYSLRISQTLFQYFKGDISGILVNFMDNKTIYSYVMESLDIKYKTRILNSYKKLINKE